MSIEKFGERIKLIRDKKRMTQQEFAKLIGVSVQTIWRWESNQRIPENPTMRRIAERSSVNLGWLLGLSEEMSAERVPEEDSRKPRSVMGMAYWGGVLDEARHTAKNGGMSALKDASLMLSMALETINTEIEQRSKSSISENISNAS